MKLSLKLLFLVCSIGLIASCAQLYKTGRGGRNGGGGNRPNNPGAGTGSGSSVFDNVAQIPASFQGKISRGVVYGANEDFVGKNEQLQMDILEPDQKSNGKYPLFIFVHGGGFLKGGRGGAGGFRAGLAEKGFVVASIDYRLGWDRGNGRSPCSGDSVEMKYAIYRAVQDLHASIRYLVANADKYQIDPNWIFLGGQSAGAVTVLNGAFLSQEEANKDIPNVMSKLGPIQGEGNNINVPFKIKGVAAMWGDLHNTDQIDRSDAVPVIFYHGSRDKVAPMNKGRVYSCPNFMEVYGTKALYEHLQNLGTSSVAQIDPNGGHGVFSDDFRINTVNCFFKNVMQGKKMSGYYVGGKELCN